MNPFPAGGGGGQEIIYFLHLFISFQRHWADPQSPDGPDILLKPKSLVLFITDLSKSGSRTYWHCFKIHWKVKFTLSLSPSRLQTGEWKDPSLLLLFWPLVSAVCPGFQLLVWVGAPAGGESRGKRLQALLHLTSLAPFSHPSASAPQALTDLLMLPWPGSSFFNGPLNDTFFQLTLSLSFFYLALLLRI